MRYWLMKSEPASFSIDDLRAADRRTTEWDGVRNYQARNFMRDDMQRGDLAFFYHSSCDAPGVVGVMQIAGAAHPDETAFDPADDHYDPKSRREEPAWFAIPVRFKRRFGRVLSLDELRREPALSDMLVLRRGNRLSITPVTAAEWQAVLQLAGE